jgi:hypothetical protein
MVEFRLNMSLVQPKSIRQRWSAGLPADREPSEATGGLGAAPGRSAKTMTQALVPKVDSLVTDATHLQIELDVILKLVRERFTALRKLDVP